ncbi:MAG: nucleotidyltransferase domain-containing protein, partial [Gemmatimonadota bacterium]
AASAASEAVAVSGVVAPGEGGDDNDGRTMSEERQRANEFAAELGRIYDDSLVTVLLYGSAARGEFRPGISDLNLLVILDELKLDQLRQSASVTRGWVEGGNPPPLMLSLSEWRGSADVFPLEYGDIRDAHVVLAGESPFTGLKIVRRHLRLQLEHELRSKKIQLREGLLVAGEKPDELGKLLVHSLSTFLTLFRGMLRLDGEKVPGSAEDVVQAVAEKVGFAPDPVLEVLDARRNGAAFAPTFGTPVVAGYLEAVEHAVRWLDGAALRADLEDEV